MGSIQLLRGLGVGSMVGGGAGLIAYLASKGTMPAGDTLTIVLVLGGFIGAVVHPLLKWIAELLALVIKVKVLRFSKQSIGEELAKRLERILFVGYVMGKDNGVVKELMESLEKQAQDESLTHSGD